VSLFLRDVARTCAASALAPLTFTDSVNADPAVKYVSHHLLHICSCFNNQDGQDPSFVVGVRERCDCNECSTSHFGDHLRSHWPQPNQHHNVHVLDGGIHGTDQVSRIRQGNLCQELSHFVYGLSIVQCHGHSMPLQQCPVRTECQGHKQQVRVYLPDGVQG
jgi:hypothetical protein